MKLRISFTRLFIPVIISSELFLLVNSILKEKVCYEDFISNTSVCKLICPPGSFAVVGMNSCHPWLTCDSEISVLFLISASVVKTVSLIQNIFLHILLESFLIGTIKTIVFHSF